MEILSRKIINSMEVLRVTWPADNKNHQRGNNYVVRFQSEIAAFPSNALATNHALKHTPESAFIEEKPVKKAKKESKKDKKAD